MRNDFDYEAYEKACERRKKENEAYLIEFEQWLQASGLKDKTIQKHISNVDFYLNVYLLREDAYGMEEGCRAARIDNFLGYFFIRKCMWSTPASIKQNAASFKKFYKCMLERGHISRGDYDELLVAIKEGTPIWTADCEDYNNPTEDTYMNLFGPGGSDLFGSVYDAMAHSLGFDGLLGIDAPHDADKLPTRQEVVDELTLALLYLTSWEEETIKGSGVRQRRAWKSADWNALDLLREEGLISCTNKAKSVYLTDTGIIEAETTLAALGLEHLIEGNEDMLEEAKPREKGGGWTIVE